MQATDIMQSRDCTTTVCNLEIGMQFPDSEKAQHNLKIAQIPRLRETEIFPLKHATHLRTWLAATCAYLPLL